MWLNKQITESMFVEKVKNQRQELEKAHRQNKDLKKKHQHLEEERNKLIELVNSNQVSILTEKNHLNALLEEFRRQKQLNLTITQRLVICNEQVELIQSCIDQINNSQLDSITNLKPIKEKLSFKWDVLECLQNMLIKTRLQVAEKDAIISELQKQENYLKNEMKILKEGSEVIESNVSQLQEEFLLARLREADLILEFDKIKRSIAFIKQELEDNIATGQDNDDEGGFHIHFTLKDKHRERIKMEEGISIARTVKLQDEIDHLKIKIKALEDIKKDISNRVSFNEEVNVHLHEVRSSVFYRLQKTNQELEQIITKRMHLAQQMKISLGNIQESVDGKEVDISQLWERINQLALKNEDFVKANDSSIVNVTESVINKLEEEIKELEDKISMF